MNNKNSFRYRSYQEENRWISRQERDYHRGNRFNTNYHRNRNYNYNSNYNYNNHNNNNNNNNNNYNYNNNRYYTHQRQYSYRADKNDSRNNINKLNNSKRHSKPKAPVVKRKPKYRKVNPIVSMLKTNGNKNVLIPIMDDNSGAYKILLHNDYLQLICMFLNLNDLLTKFVLLSKFYYLIIKSNDSGGHGNYVGRKIFNTCLNHSFPNFLNDMKINGNKFETNVSYQKHIFQLLTHWKYFIQHQKQSIFGHVSSSLSKNFPQRKHADLYHLLSCSDYSSIIIYWLKKVRDNKIINTNNNNNNNNNNE